MQKEMVNIKKETMVLVQFLSTSFLGVFGYLFYIAVIKIKRCYN